jgi:predicted amidohydrolase
MSNALTVGIYQPEARDETPESRLERLAAIFDKPQAKACDLLVCPELYLSGYFVDDLILERAETQDGPFATSVRHIAEANHCAIVYGYPEQTEGGVYNAALCAGPDGKILANHRKNLLPYDYEEKYFRAGQRPTTIELRGWRIGLLICYEVEFPEPVRYYAREGCELVVAPTALTDDWPVVAHRVLPARAFENNIFVAYANHAGTEAGRRYLGESLIASPFGRDLARAGTQEAVITARLTHEEITTARNRLHFLNDVGQSCYR